MSRQRIRKAAYGGIRVLPTSNRPEVSLSRRCTGAGIKAIRQTPLQSRVVRLSVSRARMYGQAGRLCRTDDVSRLRNDGGQFLAARRHGTRSGFRSGPGKGRNPDFIVQGGSTRSNGLARPPLIRPARYGSSGAGRSAALRNAGTGTATALPGFRRRHLQWFRHGIPLKNTASPLRRGASCPSCRRARSGKAEGGFSCGAQTGISRPQRF